MARIYLHIDEAGEILHDPDGSEVSDLEVARIEAIESARAIMSQAILSGKPLGRAKSFKLTDERGIVLLTVPFQEALHPEDRLAASCRSAGQTEEQLPNGKI
jgi:hypothetical protein